MARVGRGANKDPDFRHRIKVPDTLFDQLVRNVYKVLLTRGLRGVGIFSSDEATNEYLKSLV